MTFVTFTSSDGHSFQVDRQAIKQAGTIHNLINSLDDSDGSTMTIPLPNVRGEVLRVVINWLNEHKDDPIREEKEENRSGEGISQWDMQFVEGKANQEVFELILAANYLDIKDLLDVTCKCIANQIKGKSVEGVREHFNITRDRLTIDQFDIEMIIELSQFDILCHSIDASSSSFVIQFTPHTGRRLFRTGGEG